MNISECSQQIFARKIIHPDPRTLVSDGMTDEDKVPDNEVRIARKLTASGRHVNIVEVIRQGWLQENSSYFFDMERCVMTLDAFIHHNIATHLSFAEFVSFGFEPPTQIREVLSLWAIVRDIASGLCFIHSLQEIHRDLKPKNGRYNCRV